MKKNQIMPNTMAHHMLTNALPIPEQELATSGQLPPVYRWGMTFYVMESPLVQLGQLSWPRFLPASCAPAPLQSMRH